MDKAQQDALKKAAGIEAAKIVKNGMMALPWHRLYSALLG